MDYGKVIGGAWQITRRWKSLWVLGILSVLGIGLVGSFNPSWIFEDNLIGTLARAIIPPEIIALLVGLACLTFIIGITIWVVSIISRGGLIAGAQQAAEEGSTSFGSAWRVGASRFWTLLGISVLMVLAFIVVTGLSVLIVATILWLLQALFHVSLWTSFILGALAGLIVSAVVGVIGIYADQAAVQEGLGWTRAFGRGWDVLKANIGPTIILIFFVLGILIAIAIVAIFIGVLLGIGLGAAIWALLTNPDPSTWLVVPLCCVGLVGVVLILAVEGFFQTFKTSIWTLAYRQMAGLDEAAPAEAEEAPAKEKVAEQEAEAEEAPIAEEETESEAEEDEGEA